MTPGTALPLRDIHLPVAPGWWPPAPGWWALLALAAMALLLAGAVLWRRRRRRLALLRMFDRRVRAAGTAPDRIAAISELLRRVARERDPGAAALQGDEWLAFLDRDAETPAFAGDAGRLLLEGGYRRQVDDADVEALRTAARARFLQLAEARR